MNYTFYGKSDFNFKGTLHCFLLMDITKSASIFFSLATLSILRYAKSDLIISSSNFPNVSIISANSTEICSASSLFS